jgi:hypothetical protein
MVVKAQLADGRSLEFPDGTDPAVVQRTVKNLLGKGGPPEPELDTTTGAPWGVRTGVGAAPNANDRLATIRKSYPDARPEGSDNFIYTDPVTKKPTLYNPPGLDAGDAFSILPEVGEFAGGVVGGATGVAAMPATGGASALTVPLMTGAGATLGKKIAETGAQYLAGTVDNRSFTEHVTDDAVTGGVNTVAGPAAETMLRGARHVIGPKVQPLVNQAFENLGIKKMAGAVTGSQMVQSAEHGAFNSPGGTSTMQKSYEATQDDVQKAAGKIADNLAGTTRPNQATAPRSIQDAGTTLKKGVSAAGEKFAKNRQDLDDIATQAVGATRPTQLTNTQQLLTDLQAELARAPNSRPELRRAIQEAERLMTDAQANGGVVPFDVLRKVRTRIGRELEQPDASGYLPGEDGYMRQLYGKLKDDVFGAAREADAAVPGAVAGQKGPAELALEKHDRYVRMFRGDSGGRVPPIATFDKVLAAGSDAKALQYAMEGSEQSTQRLWQLRRSLKPEEWDVVAASIFDTLGRAKPGAQGGSMLGEVGNDFSVATFLTNWQKLNAGQPGRTTRDVLFGGSQYGHVKGAINDLVTVVESLKSSQKLGNPSGTARSTAWNGLFAGLGGSLGAIGTGTVTGTLASAAAGAAGHFAAGYGTARLLTSPKFVRWLTTSARTIGTQPNSWQSALTRLDLIAEHEPELRDEINQYRAQVANTFKTSAAAATP